MSAIKETLSPIFKTSQVRRKSLEICQKVFSPNSKFSTPFPQNSPTQINQNVSNSFGKQNSPNFLKLVKQSVLGEQSLQSLSVPKGNIKGRRYSDSASEKLFLSQERNDADLSSKRYGITQQFHSFFANQKDYEHDELHKQESRELLSSKDSIFKEYVKIICSRCHIILDHSHVLGRGSFGTVFSAFHYGDDVAVKIVNTKSKLRKESLENERNLMCIPPHPSVVRLIKIYEPSKNYAFIVMERLCKDDLQSWINFDEDYNLEKLIKFSRQIASGLLHCHNHHLIHLDLKPKNILLDGHGNCKLSDFGNSKYEDYKPSRWTSQGGTTAYKAPELFCNGVASKKCDVYSFGVTLWQILTHEIPYLGIEEHTIIYKVVAQDMRPKVKNSHIFQAYLNSKQNHQIHLDTIIDKFISLCKACWQPNPLFRPSIQQILQSLNSIQSKPPASPLPVPTISIKHHD